MLIRPGPPSGPYDAVVANPPWRFVYRSKDGERVGRPRYGWMDTDAIAALPVEECAAPDAVLFIWTSGPHVPKAFAVMNAWGFDYAGHTLTWVKLNKDGSLFKGMGYLVRASCEFCLVGVRGRGLRRRDKTVPDVIRAQRRQPRRKPEDQYEVVERLYGPCRRLEVFPHPAAPLRPGWDAWAPGQGGEA